MSQDKALTLRPIGRVVEGPSWPVDPGWEERDALVEIEPDWTDALDGLEGCSHVWLLWWPDAYETPPDTLYVHPEGRQELPLTGIFATRSPHRPNPLVMTAVRLIERDGGRLRVRGLDARQGTPILDIKPYIARDSIPDATPPAWFGLLQQLDDKGASME